MKLALVLWNGNIGGAETLTGALAEHMARFGSEPTVVFIAHAEPLCERIDAAMVPYRTLGFSRGRQILRHPRRLASEVAEVGPDGSLLVECGYLGAALRAGGYCAPIVGVEHGAVLQRETVHQPLRAMRLAGRLLGARADDAEVAVSDYVLDRMRREPHARCLRRIYNGIEARGPSLARDGGNGSRQQGSIVIGFMGRLIAGKGADHLLRALAELRRSLEARLLIAGEGPEQSELLSLAEGLRLGSSVQFLGTVADRRWFWRQCDIAVIPSDAWIETFSMVTLEAMACAKPIVATRQGGIVELVVDGLTGTLVTPGSVTELVDALKAYAAAPELASSHGAAACTRALDNFNIEDSARAYLSLFSELQSLNAGAAWKRYSDMRGTGSHR